MKRLDHGIILDARWRRAQAFAAHRQCANSFHSIYPEVSPLATFTLRVQRAADWANQFHMNDELRALFPVTQRAIYLNHAAVSAPPIPTVEAIQSQLKDVSENGSVNFRQWLRIKERARELLAEMLGARPEQVAFMRNTSDGLSTVANGFNWQPGDNLVTFAREFPSNLYPWLRIRDALGVEVRLCEERDGGIDLGELSGLIDDRTRIVAISHVQYASGFRADLERIARVARAHDALLVVDVIQSRGRDSD